MATLALQRRPGSTLRIPPLGSYFSSDYSLFPGNSNSVKAETLSWIVHCSLALALKTMVLRIPWHGRVREIPRLGCPAV